MKVEGEIEVRTGDPGAWNLELVGGNISSASGSYNGHSDQLSFLNDS